MFSLSSLSSLVSRVLAWHSKPSSAKWFSPVAVAAPVEAPEQSLSQFIKELADDAAAAPAAPVVAMPTFHFKVFAKCGSEVMLARSVCAANEAAALSLIDSHDEERIQIVGGSRYRVIITNGSRVFRQIERIDRSGSGARAYHTQTLTEKGSVVGQPTLPYYSDEVLV